MGMRCKSFTLPEACIQRIQRAARVLGVSESEVVRRAVDEFAAKVIVLESSESNEEGR